MNIKYSLSILVLVVLIGNVRGQLRGVNYGVQRGDGSCSNYQQILADFQYIKTFAQAVKIFQAGYCNGAQNVLQAAGATGLKVFLGVQAAPDDVFNNEKAALRSAYALFGFANVLGITVGSEDLYRGSVSSASLAAKILDVKSVVRSLGSQAPITHTDVYYLQPQNIIDADDIVMFNAFPYWEGVNINNAAATMIAHYNSVKAAAGGKTVWIGETGWPTAGATQTNAVANSANMNKYLNDFACWANANGIPYFWFEAFDEPWKGAGAESNWGLYTNERVKKSGFTLTCATPTSATPTPTSATPTPTSVKTSATPTPTSATPTPTSVKTSATPAPTSVKTSTTAQTPAPTSGTCTKGSCPTNLCSCNGACYSPSNYVCTTDNKGTIVLCPLGNASCNGGCYDTKLYTCGPNGIEQKKN